jgi:hypothetical protein
MGFDLVGDDIILVDRDTGEIAGVPLPLSVKEGSVGLLESLYPGLRQRPAHAREDGENVRYCPLPGSMDEAARRVGAIVSLHRDEEAPCALRPWPGIDCLRRLLGDCHHPTGRADGRFVRALAQRVEKARRIELTFPNAREGARALAASLAT